LQPHPMKFDFSAPHACPLHPPSAVTLIPSRA
jgi:hypothetical protein